MSSKQYTIYLLNDVIKSFNEALNQDKKVSRHDLKRNLGFTGALFVGEQKKSHPSWVDLLNSHLLTPVKRAFTANISAVLLVNYSSRFFAITFGHGKGMLAASSWVQDFGLKVTLNRVDPSKLRSIDSKTYEDMVLSTRRQASRSSTVNNFDLDVARDLIRGVTGDALDTNLFKRLTGSDSLSITTNLSFDHFDELLEDLLIAYNETKYKSSFGWIDNVKEVNSSERQELDNCLVAALRSGNTTGMHLAPADVFEWKDVVGFNFTGGKKSTIYPELDLQDYVQILNNDLAKLDIDQLKRHRVRIRYDGSDVFHDEWPVYQCIIWETDSNGKKYVLFDARWFEIENSYATRVVTFLNDISVGSIVLPDGKPGDYEGVYNKSVAIGDPNQFALLDKQTVRATGAATPIEFCDLMSKNGHLIHVKKRSASATLSHLFSQGAVSADAFLRDEEVRHQVRSKLKELKKNEHHSLIPISRPTPANFEVVYAILAKDETTWPPRLPFFSAVNLMHHASRIQSLGFKVSLQHVKQVSNGP